MRVFKPTQKYIFNGSTLKIFLAGSIEMGTAIDWQEQVTEQLSQFGYVDILNPRRVDWDSSWEQKITNDKFNEQVTWELDNLDNADIIFMNLLPDTLSPISLLELGLFVNLDDADKRLIVCCPEGFWRKGNVDIVCDRYNIPLFDNQEQAIAYLEGYCYGWGAFHSNVISDEDKILLRQHFNIS